MKHLSEKSLTAHALGFGDSRFISHLEACARCRGRLKEMQAVLELTATLPVPTPDAEFAQRVWWRLEPQLAEVPRPVSIPLWRRPVWVLTPALAAVLLVFFLSRPSRIAEPSTPRSATSHQVAPSPVLLFAVSRHLDRTQAFLVELSHADQPEPGQQLAARELLASNRLYQQGANGDASISAMLGAIEPTLIELAHTSEHVSPAAWRQVRERIAASGLLFKVRVVDQTLQSRLNARVQQEQDGTL